jgi:protein-ribulosamine 3-kinase
VKLPADARRATERVVGELRELRPVGGGCISRTTEVVGERGRAFLKWSDRHPAALYHAEADGLRTLRHVDHGLVVPEVLGVCGAEPSSGWILLEWLSPGDRRPDFWRRLGEGVAVVHGATNGRWGWGSEGYIGSVPQDNQSAGTWAEFWIERRLKPQLRRAAPSGLRPGSVGDWERLFSMLPEMLAPAEEEGPSLLHGDLWSGNVMAVRGGVPALIDPSLYHGHREVDLAMADLFGGFDQAFWNAYEETAPLRFGSERRKYVYQLYYLLVHVNLFGVGYVGRTAAALRSALTA